MNSIHLVLRLVRFTNTAFWRNAAAAFFTFVFPLMFLAIFTTLIRHTTIIINGISFRSSTYYVAAMAAFSVISTCYTNLAISVSIQRDTGVLKRLRGTPLPGWAYLTARLIHAVIVAVILVIICGTYGHYAYGSASFASIRIPDLAFVLFLGAGTFASLGLFVTTAIPHADASPAIVNATILPLQFVSGIFIPVQDNTPGWAHWVARIFPVKHFADAMREAFVGLPLRWSNVLVVGTWGVAGLALASRFFSWEPRR